MARARRLHILHVVEPYTRYQYMRYIVRFLKWATGHPGMTPTASVQGYLDSLPATSQPIARRALKHQQLAGVEWSKVTVTTTKRNVARLGASVLDGHELALLRTLTHPRDRVLVTLPYVLRRAECAVLQWEHIDFVHSRVMVIRGKGGKSAATVLPRPTLEALMALWESCGRPATGPVIVTEQGHAPTPQWIGKRVKALFTRLGIDRPYRAPHALRRTFATRYLEANPEDLRGLQQLMRHEHMATTGLYTFLNPDVLAPRVAKVDL